MPEEQPLYDLTLLELILEAKSVILIEFVQKVEKLCGSLHDGKSGRLSIVNDDRNPT